jgi:hypothetical protein
VIATGSAARDYHNRQHSRGDRQPMTHTHFENPFLIGKLATGR